MKINLEEITFSKEEIISYLEKEGFKIETHNTWTGTMGNVNNGKSTSWNSDKEYAIPTNEDFDVAVHKKIDETFKKLIESKIKSFLTNL